VLSKEPGTLNDATNTARAMWKRKHPVGQLPKLPNLTMSPVTTTIEETINGLPDDIREECILANKNKRNNTFRNNQGNTQQNNYSGYQGSNNGQPKNQNKDQKQKNKNSSNSTYNKITCWFCNKKGHTQITCRTRIGLLGFTFEYVYTFTGSNISHLNLRNKK
jgi:excinuclease UvrABC ATPase subunit